MRPLSWRCSLRALVKEADLRSVAPYVGKVNLSAHDEQTGAVGRAVTMIGPHSRALAISQLRGNVD